MLLVSIVRVSAVLCATSWISVHLEYEVPVNSVTSVRAWRKEEPDYVKLDLINLVRCLLSKEGVPFGLGAFQGLLRTTGRGGGLRAHIHFECI